MMLRWAFQILRRVALLAFGPLILLFAIPVAVGAARGVGALFTSRRKPVAFWQVSLMVIWAWLGAVFGRGG